MTEKKKQTFDRRSSLTCFMVRLFRAMRIFTLFNLKTVFLPRGYPQTVSADYMEYQIWDTIQALASSVTGALAAQAILVGVGVGNAQATILGASFAWMLKDGAGMIGKIAFVGWKGRYLDCDCKLWRFVADIVNDIALFLELSSPFFPAIFTPLVCAANILKSVVSVAGGATRAAIVLHQAIDNNVADVAAKDGSQETLSNLLALIFNLSMVYFVTGNWTVIWLAFSVLTTVHLYANYRAVRCLQLQTFNRTRFSIAVQSWLHKSLSTYSHSSGGLSSMRSPFPSVTSVNAREPILIFPQTADVRLQSSHPEFVAPNHKDSTILEHVFSEEKYLLHCSDWKRFTNGATSDRRQGPLSFHIILRDGFGSEDQILAMLHLELLIFLEKVRIDLCLPEELREVVQSDSVQQFYRTSLTAAKALFKSLIFNISTSPEPRWKLDAPQFGIEDGYSMWTEQ